MLFVQVISLRLLNPAFVRNCKELIGTTCPVFYLSILNFEKQERQKEVAELEQIRKERIDKMTDKEKKVMVRLCAKIIEEMEN